MISGRIDWENEEVRQLLASREWFPGEVKPSPNTLHRWRQHGVVVGGEIVVLEAFKMGHWWYTSKEAVARFIERQNPPAPPARPTSPGGESSPAKSPRGSKRHQQAVRELEKMGLKSG